MSGAVDQPALVQLAVDYSGEEFLIDAGTDFTIGRDADLVVDEDNPFLHRRMVELRYVEGFWWIVNVGSRLSVTVSGEDGSLNALVGPGARIPMVLPSLVIMFTAGQTTYEVIVRSDVPVFTPTPAARADSADETLGAVALTSSQHRLLVALSEHMLRRVGSGPSDLPSNARAAARLGWPITTFNRKLDNVCDKFSRAGVKGLRGSPGQYATQRRVRLVEYAVAARIVRAEHLPLLDHEEPS